MYRGRTGLLKIVNKWAFAIACSITGLVVGIFFQNIRINTGLKTAINLSFQPGHAIDSSRSLEMAHKALKSIGLDPVSSILCNGDGNILASFPEKTAPDACDLVFQSQNIFSYRLKAPVSGFDVPIFYVLELKVITEALVSLCWALLSFLFGLLVFSFLEWREKIRSELRFNRVLSGIAKQVSHDIRSPLSVLDMILRGGETLTEENRNLVRRATQRINDIANGLLHHESLQNVWEPGRSLATELVMIGVLLEDIVDEKRIQYRSEVPIDFSIDHSHGYGLFVMISSIEFARAVSNLINNSVEAFDPCKTQRQVKISIRGYQNQVLVVVTDNGKGIPSDVLDKIGMEGVSYGKEGGTSGSGLGVYQARKAMEDANGKLEVQSKINEGTMVSLILPRAKMPEWHVEKLVLNKGAKLISIDEDQEIQKIWDKRLSAGGPIEHVRFLSSTAFKEWFTVNTQKNMTFVFGYEFQGRKENGLDLIEEMGLASSSILVTYRFDENKIQRRARDMGVRIIPARLVSFIPIEIRNN